MPAAYQQRTNIHWSIGRAVRVGFAALDAAGSILLILVEPGYQRRGIGTGLLEAALQKVVRAGTASTVTAGSGGAGYRPWRRYAMYSSPA
jgi:GNAT superfamily N-acetyltransferase